MPIVRPCRFTLPLLLLPSLLAQGLVSSLDPNLQAPLLSMPGLPFSNQTPNCTLPWDFDNDGDTDILVGHTFGLLLLRNDGCTGTYTDVQSLVLGPSSFGGLPNPGVFCGDIGDVDGDGIDDAIVSTTLPNANWIIRGGLVGGLLRTSSLGLPWPQLVEVELVDVTDDVATGGLFALDGQLDVVGCSATTFVPNPSGPGILITRSGALHVAAGTAPGPFGPAFLERSPAAPASTVPFGPDTNYSSIAVADFTGDGRPDVLVSGATVFTGVYPSLPTPLQWPIVGVDRLYANPAASAVLVDTTATAFAGAAAPQQRGNTFTTLFDVDGDGDQDLVVDTAFFTGTPSGVGNGLAPPINRSVFLGWHPNNGVGAVPQFGARINLGGGVQPAFPVPTPTPPQLPFGNFIVGDLFGDDGVPDLIHSAGVFAGVPGGMMVGAALASPLLLESLDGAVLDLDCSGVADLLVSSRTGSNSQSLVAQLDTRVRLDGPADALIGTSTTEDATFVHLNAANNLTLSFLAVSNGQTIPGVPLPGFEGLARLGPNFVILPGPNFATTPVQLPPTIVTFFFQAIDFWTVGTTNFVGFSNVVQTNWDGF